MEGQEPSLGAHMGNIIFAFSWTVVSPRWKISSSSSFFIKRPFDVHQAGGQIISPIQNGEN